MGKTKSANRPLSAVKGATARGIAVKKFQTAPEAIDRAPLRLLSVFDEKSPAATTETFQELLEKAVECETKISGPLRGSRLAAQSSAVVETVAMISLLNRLDYECMSASAAVASQEETLSHLAKELTILKTDGMHPVTAGRSFFAASLCEPVGCCVGYVSELWAKSSKTSPVAAEPVQESSKSSDSASVTSPKPIRQRSLTVLRALQTRIASQHRAVKNLTEMVSKLHAERKSNAIAIEAGRVEIEFCLTQ
jgi:hypothetical protein